MRSASISRILEPSLQGLISSVYIFLLTKLYFLGGRAQGSRGCEATGQYSKNKCTRLQSAWAPLCHAAGTHLLGHAQCLQSHVREH